MVESFWSLLEEQQKENDKNTSEKRGRIDPFCQLVKCYRIKVIKIVYHCYRNRQLSGRDSSHVDIIMKTSHIKMETSDTKMETRSFT